MVSRRAATGGCVNQLNARGRPKRRVSPWRAASSGLGNAGHAEKYQINKVNQGHISPTQEKYLGVILEIVKSRKEFQEPRLAATILSIYIARKLFQPKPMCLMASERIGVLSSSFVSGPKDIPLEL